MDKLQNLEKKIGEAIGLEKASQAAVEKINCNCQLDKYLFIYKINNIKKQNKNNQRILEEKKKDF